MKTSLNWALKRAARDVFRFVNRRHRIFFSLPLEEKVKYSSENETVAFLRATSSGQTFLQCHIKETAPSQNLFLINEYSVQQR